MYDGRFGNNAWLQELPDPVTKVTWENTAAAQPRHREGAGRASADSLAKVTVGERTVEGGVVVLPGHADDTVTMSLGYGRTARGERLSGRHGLQRLRPADRGPALVRPGRS